MYQDGLHDSNSIYSLSAGFPTIIDAFIIIMYPKYFGQIYTSDCLSV